MTSKPAPTRRAIASIHGMPRPLEVLVDARAGRFRLDGHERRVEDCQWDPPQVGTVYGAALGFRAALAALGDAVERAPYKAPPRAPVLYIKPANTFVGWGAPVPLDDDVPEVVVGATVGIVIGRTACNVPARDALSCVAGYMPVNDVTVPHDSYFRPAIHNKVRDGFCPMGPWIVAAAAVPDPDRLTIRAFVNGEQRFVGSTADLVRPVATLLADISAFLTLSPGDVVLVGLPHGLPTARVGDRVAVEIDGVGRLENPIVAGHAVPGGRVA